MTQQEDRAWSAPKVTCYGTIEEMTLALNKVGGSADAYSAIVPVVGSILSV